VTPAAFTLVDADYGADLEHLRAVRETVFVQEQRVPLALEWDEQDPQARHVLALNSDGQPIGTGRLTGDGRIGRMAVLAAWRGRGVGSALLLHLVELARAKGMACVELHAQVSAIDFYAGHGFHAWGEPFDEAGIQHRHMRQVLAAQGSSSPRPDA